MMCPEVIELMQRYLDQDLEETEYLQMLGHLQQCPDCSELFERLKKLSAELEQLPKVMPPYSLVDAILPAIEQIDKGISSDAAWLPHHEEATARPAAESETAPVKERSRRTGSWRSHVREWVSFPVLGGVVAAGLIFGFFVFQQERTTSTQVAESVASSSDLAKAASAGKTGPEDHAPKAASDMNGSQNAAPVGAEATQSSGSPQSTPPEASKQPALGSTGADQKPAPTVNAGKNGPGTSKGTKDEPDNTATMKTSPPAAAEQQASAQQPEAANKAEKPNEQTPIAGANNGGDIQERTGAIAPSEPAKTLDEGKPRASLGGDTIYGLKALPAHEKKSPDGAYTAYVINQQVIIKNKQNEEIYKSKYEAWDGADLIELRSWNGAKLTYSVQINGVIRTFEIDLQKQTEQEITVKSQP